MFYLQIAKKYTWFCSVDLDDLWRRSKLVLLLVLVAGRLEKLVGETTEFVDGIKILLFFVLFLECEA